MKTRLNKIAAFLTSILCAVMCVLPATANAFNFDITENIALKNTVSTSDRATWYVVSETAGPGSDVQVDIIVRNPIALSQVNDIGLSVASPIQITGISSTCPAYAATISSNISGNTVMFDINGSSSATGGADKSTLFSVFFHIPNGCANGDYAIKWISNDMTAFQPNGQAYFPILRDGRITVSGSIAPTTTSRITLPPPRTTTTTTSKTTTTTTTTTTITTT
ncbi:MAG: hypothetical protein IJ010_02250, partial [Ruminococcus sp.]|nr:hypothetical protein [Ruminococcus sp.]